MSQIGDLVPKSGLYTEPGVIVEKKDDGTVKIDTEPLTINKYHRYHNTTGLTEEEKNQFNEILDTIYTKEDDLEKINDIQKEIDHLKIDANHKNVVTYLKHQQAMLIRKCEKMPRFYNQDESQIKF